MLHAPDSRELLNRLIYLCTKINYFTAFRKFLGIFQKFCNSKTTFYKFTKENLNL